MPKRKIKDGITILMDGDSDGIEFTPEPEDVQTGEITEKHLLVDLAVLKLPKSSKIIRELFTRVIPRCTPSIKVLTKLAEAMVDG